MLKHLSASLPAPAELQPPSGGCVLKLLIARLRHLRKTQPPSGGCVLKLNYLILKKKYITPAAFRRLCVETDYEKYVTKDVVQPPSGGCVLKPFFAHIPQHLIRQPPSGGCVLKQIKIAAQFGRMSSRLQAAVC